MENECEDINEFPTIEEMQRNRYLYYCWLKYVYENGGGGGQPTFIFSVDDTLTVTQTDYEADISLAEGKVEGKHLKDATITSSKIANNQITGGQFNPKIAEATVTNRELAGNSVTNSQISNNAVTRNKLDGDVVDGDSSNLLEFRDDGLYVPNIASSNSISVLKGQNTITPSAKIAAASDNNLEILSDGLYSKLVDNRLWHYIGDLNDFTDLEKLSTPQINGTLIKVFNPDATTQMYEWNATDEAWEESSETTGEIALLQGVDYLPPADGYGNEQMFWILHILESSPTHGGEGWYWFTDHWNQLDATINVVNSVNIGDMNPVTSNAVAQVIENINPESDVYYNDGDEIKPLPIELNNHKQYVPLMNETVNYSFNHHIKNDTVFTKLNIQLPSDFKDYTVDIYSSESGSFAVKFDEEQNIISLTSQDPAINDFIFWDGEWTGPADILGIGVWTGSQLIAHPEYAYFILYEEEPFPVAPDPDYISYVSVADAGLISKSNVDTDCFTFNSDGKLTLGYTWDD
ncbi:MAG: hypothetical protein LBC39_02610 [Methanobrevibacter sp.]|jgi:hypothetical protein|nr:hypothetical protein [Candidatus Methanovirga aequatorialis]